MSRLEELIEELCPDGVEYSCLGKICVITRGRVMSKDYIRDNVGDYPVYSSQTENNGELGKIDSYDFEGEYLTWTTDGANAGSVFYRNGKFSVTNVCGLLEIKNDKIVAKYLYYALSIKAPFYVNRGMGNPKLMSNVMAKIIVPIPPIEVQSEIVRILDNFTELTAELTVELTAELTARKKQYEYYRDEMMKFDDNVPQVLLGDVGDVTKLAGFEFTEHVQYKDEGSIIALRGLNVKNGKLDLTQVKYIDGSNFNKLSRSKLESGDMLFTYVGTVGQSYSIRTDIKND